MSMSKDVRSLNPETARKIDELDLALAEERLQHPELGEGWSKEKAQHTISEYRHFLKMVALGGTVVPTKDVDKVWHTHILDTRTYARDCQNIFGKFIHHMPYMAEADLKVAWKKTVAQSKEVLGREYVQNFGGKQ